jgi:hypothetical protein
VWIERAGYKKEEKMDEKGNALFPYLFFYSPFSISLFQVHRVLLRRPIQKIEAAAPTNEQPT